MDAKSLITAGIIVSLSAFPVWAEKVIRERPAEGGQEWPQERKGQVERKKACECCKTCMGAKKPVTGKEDGPPAKDGCRECCERCGHDQVPSEQQMPPEIMK